MHMDIIEKLYNICSEQRRTDYPKKDRELKGRKYQILKEKLSPELADELEATFGMTYMAVPFISCT